MADWWESTPESYLSYVSKDRNLSVVTEAVSPPNAELLRGLKKADLIQQADSELSDLRSLPDNSGQRYRWISNKGDTTGS
ncbi:hypothetical protein EBAPG3_014060 [Nitrosospira lacus]|uniref:Uncharacterized protein n=1 Tax=Nitrosospira lacus TaxID=1288494 RepID=A0A1W6SSM1_9PROT|nr:hypothetical protein [Nitrosospira lacus]ARO88802.1 hypothetical protein EBAPG3_014060 [Nitrosospira lacus]